MTSYSEASLIKLNGDPGHCESEYDVIPLTRPPRLVTANFQDSAYARLQRPAPRQSGFLSASLARRRARCMNV